MGCSKDNRNVAALKDAMSKKTVLITDVDNTLLDWVDVWFKSFSAMMDQVESISGIPSEILYPSISLIHQKYKTSEYAFLLESIPELQKIYGDRVNTVMQPAIDAYRKARNEALSLYPGVFETISYLRGKGVLLVAYTESMSFYTNYRFRKLGLDTVFDFLYSPPDHEIPDDTHRKLRKYSDEHYRLKITQHRHTPEGELKPNPDILLSILSDVGRQREEAIYVGDSLMKDIAMAQAAGVLDAFAAYGVAQHREQYELLKKVTHWSKADVERERAISAGNQSQPSLILKSSFSEVNQYF